MKKMTIAIVLFFLLVSLGFSDLHPGGMVLILEGEFLMGLDEKGIARALEFCQKYRKGCRKSWFTHETPQRVVFLDSFYIDVQEVTAEDFVLFLNKRGNKCQGAPCFYDFGNEGIILKEKDKWVVRKDFRENPATDITWAGADEYCKWKGKRLPTEAQWEKAARGIEGRFFPWGDKWEDSKANFCDRDCPNDWGTKSELINYDDLPTDGQDQSGPVNKFSSGKSPYGLFNMSGNAWEWVSDFYLPTAYSDLPKTNPTGPKTGSAHVLRGGGWNVLPDHLRSTARFREGEGSAKGARGFRCAKEVK